MTAEYKKNFFIENIRTVVEDMLQEKQILNGKDKMMIHCKIQMK